MRNLSQLDVVWLAADEIGKLAAMITAGAGPIPMAVLRGSVDVLLLEESLLQLPIRSRAVLRTDVPDPTSYRELSERGLFVYDWTDVHLPSSMAKQAYELVAEPSEALMLSEVDYRLQAAAFPMDSEVIGCSLISVP